MGPQQPDRVCSETLAHVCASLPLAEPALLVVPQQAPVHRLSLPSGLPHPSQKHGCLMQPVCLHCHSLLQERQCHYLRFTPSEEVPGSEGAHTPQRVGTILINLHQRLLHCKQGIKCNRGACWSPHVTLDGTNSGLEKRTETCGLQGESSSSHATRSIAFNLFNCACPAELTRGCLPCYCLIIPAWMWCTFAMHCSFLQP